MGISGLHRYICEHIPHARQTIDLIEEIENYKSKHGKPPTILIDIKEFSQLVVQRDETGIVCGGRHPYYMFKIRKLLEALKNAGAILVFFAVGSKLNDVPHIFIPKREAEYTKYLKILQRIDEKVPIRQILKQKNRKSADIRATLSVEHNLIKVCKQYGEVHYNYVRHNQEIAQYANMHENDVLAIIAGDTDFLVFDGQFEYWPATQIDEKELMGVRVCRQTVWDALEVTPQQLAMVGALSGSIYLPQYVDKVKAFYEKIERGGPEFLKIRDLTTYVRNIRQTPIGNGATIEFDVDAVARDVFGDGYADEEMNTIKNGLAIYNLKFKIPMEKDLMLQQLKRFDRLLYLIQMTDKVFNVRDIAYIDFQNVRSKTYAELVCPLLLRILGIMFIERQGSDFAREICMKFSHEDPYEVVEESPCYPPSDLRFPFRKLYEDRNNERPHKWQLLLWTIDVDYSLWEKFKDLPHDMVTPLATLTYLVEQGELSIVEADAICLAEYDERRHRAPRNIRYGNCLDGRLVRVAHLYTKMYEWICACFRVCGMPVFSDFIKFDGAVFHNYVESFKESAALHSDKICSIKAYRFYNTDE